jgi:hypothetical protein
VKANCLEHHWAISTIVVRLNIIRLVRMKAWTFAEQDIISTIWCHIAGKALVVVGLVGSTSIGNLAGFSLAASDIVTYTVTETLEAIKEGDHEWSSEWDRGGHDKSCSFNTTRAESPYVSIGCIYEDLKRNV